VRFKWDKKKNEQLIKKRNIDFEIAGDVFEHPYHLSQKSDDPEQWRAIGWIKGHLITLIYEEREDEEGIYYWFVTAWNSTNTERNLFNED